MIIFPLLLGAGLIGIVKFVHDRQKKRYDNQVIEANSELISLIINGSTYKFPYENNKTKRMELAIQFCSAQGESLGFTMQTFPDCVNPITNQLDTKMSLKVPSVHYEMQKKSDKDSLILSSSDSVSVGSDLTEVGSEKRKERLEYEILQEDTSEILEENTSGTLEENISETLEGNISETLEVNTSEILEKNTSFSTGEIIVENTDNSNMLIEKPADDDSKPADDDTDSKPADDVVKEGVAVEDFRQVKESTDQ